MFGFGWLARIAAWLAGINLGDIVGSVLRIYEKQADKAIAEKNVQGEVAIELIRSDVAHINARRDLGLAAMTHPVWWIAWAFFVIPVGVYDGMIFFVSTFDAWLNAPGCIVPTADYFLEPGQEFCDWYVKRVPDDQREARHLIVLSIFGLQGAAGIAGAIIQRVWK